MDKEKREPEKPKNKVKASHGRNFIPEALRRVSVQKALMLAGFSLLVSLLLTPSFVFETPFYQLGDIATQNIKAKRDFLVEDREATAKKREEAARQAAVVYDLDESVLQRVQERLGAAFQAMRDDLREAQLPNENHPERQTETALSSPERQSALEESSSRDKLLR